MKTKALLLLTIILVLAFAGCGNDDTEEQEPIDQSATLNDLFGRGLSATVTGYMTNSQWNGVAGKIETALNGAYEAGNSPTKGMFRAVFGMDGGVTIFVEKTSEYSTYKTVGDGTLYLNLDALNNANLQEKIIDAVTAMRNGEATIGKAIKTGHDKRGAEYLSPQTVWCS